ncbi:MAG: hypothetical protein WBP26_02200 [Candidatus Saccharimonadales bacterium]
MSKEDHPTGLGQIVHDRLLSVVLTGALAFGATSCTEGTPSEPAASVAQSSESSVAASTIPGSPTPTLNPYPECTPGTGVVYEGLSTDPIGPSDSFRWLGTIGDELDAAAPDAQPEEYANLFLDKVSGDISFDASIVIDPSLKMSTWGADEATEKGRLLSSLDNIAAMLARYPAGYLKKFGVDTLRLADNYTNYGGHYDTTANEISFEYDQPTGDQALYPFVSHELAHAYHDKYCDGNTKNDPELSGYNSVDYVGYFGDASTESQREKLYAQVPQELYVYGPAREFASTYGLSSVAEDFATIAQLTFAERGLVQPGDADYGSSFHRKQELIVKRLESMIPGITVFLQEETRAIRLNPSNEIYADVPTVAVPRQTITDFLGANSGRKVVMNGLLPASFQADYPQTSVTVLPTVQFADMAQSKISVYISRSEHFSSYMSLDSNNPTLDFSLFVPASDIQNGVYVGQLLRALDDTPYSIVDSIETMDTERRPELQTLIAEHPRLIRVKVQ